MLPDWWTDGVEDVEIEDALEELAVGVWESVDDVIIAEIEDAIDFELSDAEDVFIDEPWLIPVVVVIAEAILDDVVTEIEDTAGDVFGSEVDIDTIPLPPIEFELEDWDIGIDISAEILLDEENEPDGGGVVIGVQY